MANENGRKLSSEQREILIIALRTRFEENKGRHKDMEWSKVEARLDAHPDKLWSLHEMESTGGEPDVVGCDRSAGAFMFFDCSKESPKGRRNLCYDREGQEARERRGVHPAGNAMGMAEAMGIDLLTEEQYRELQRLGSFDIKTSSWIRTPTNIRTLGGALFADRRYGHVFVYHNSAPSFYSSRGFRGSLRV
ncbi:MAG TPA: DUF4256 domain-containing protein [Methanomassiliicoccales archaeon]|jgi:hypothetical protein|nr:DUF4256 domain-containing protein [Methanomassiliicoccales archaeon]